MSTAAPAIAFVDPDPDWQRFPPAGIRLFLLFVEQTLKIGAREFVLVTVGAHHASVLVVADRTPREIAQIELTYYDQLTRFLKEGLFRQSVTAHLEGLGSRWEARIEWGDTAQGEGMTISLKAYLVGA